MNSIEIKNLTYSYPGASAPTLKDINLEIEKGDFLAIVGNNGCGKSTLCKVMNGLIPHFITGEFQGDVLVGGISTLESDIGTLAQKVGYVYQDFENQIVRPTVLDDASYACMNYGMKDYKERGMKALELCGLTGRENDYVFQLSGGQTHLLALAGAEALSRVEELQASNIFPPQVTLAAYELEKKGKIPSAGEYPSTVEEGKKAFRRLTFRDQYMEYQIRQKKRETSVEYKHAAVSYRSVKGEPRKIFEDLNLEISRGEKIALIGSNGAGKSTLMKMMTGLLKPSSGEVLIKDISTRNAKPENLSKYVSLVYQNPEDMFIKDSIENDISFAMKARGIDNWEKRTSQLLERFRLTELKDRDGRLLSGGQMRRASLAIGIALNPEILLLDEPTANLDIATRKEIMRTLNDMKDITETVMIATHDMQLVCEWAQRIIVLSQGKIIADGTRDQIFGNQEAVKTAGIRPPEIFTMGQVLDKRAFCYTVDEFLKGFGG